MTARMKTGDARLAGAEIIARVSELRPWLREHQAEAERQRRIPQDSIERLDQAGVFSLTAPARFGGADLTVRELHDIYRVLASGCGATAWVVWAAAGGNLWSFAFPDEVMAPVYESAWTGNRTFALGGTSRRMSGTARQVDGGWAIKGVWPFATGSVHASHGYLAAFYDETDDAKVGMALVAKDQLIARDDWDAMGLAATGSGGLVRSLVSGAGVARGMADQAMEAYLAGIGKRSIPYSPYQRAADAPFIHHTVGEAHMRIRAAGVLADAAVAALDDCDTEQRDLTDSETLRYHTDVAHIWHECADAVEALFHASGAAAIMKRQSLQLIARNCRAGSLHAAYSIDTWLENVGRSLCGSGSAPISTGVLERKPQSEERRSS